MLSGIYIDCDMRQELERKYEEAFKSLTDEDRKRLTDAVCQIVGEREVDAALFTLRIKLEGRNFHATVPADYAHALWKLQQAYYRLVATVLYEDPTATLTLEEKKKFLLVFSIESGSTDSEASLLSAFIALAESVADKMEPWEILLLAALMCLTYLGAKGLDGYLEHKDKKLLSDAETKRKEIDAQQYAQALDSQVKVADKAFALVEKYRSVFTAAQEAGRDGRIAVLKGVSGIERAEIGERTYTADRIADLKRRSPKTKAVSEVRAVNVAVIKIDSEDKSYPKLTLRERNSDAQYVAEISRQECEEDYENAMDIIWDSARYPNRFFWAEVLLATRKGKLVECSVLTVARTKEELMSGYEEQDGTE